MVELVRDNGPSDQGHKKVESTFGSFDTTATDDAESGPGSATSDGGSDADESAAGH